MSDYYFEKLNHNNLNDLLSIYKDAFSKEVSLEFLQKKQDTSYAGPSYVGYIAYSAENEPAAFYGVYPCFIDYNGKKYLAAQSGDTMTHSKHTGKGLFTSLATKTYEYCKENGINLVFGFPNQNSYPGFTKKLNWIHFDDLISYQIKVKCIPWIRIKKIVHLSQKIHNLWGSFILQLLPKGKAFTSSAKDINIPVIDHSEDFFKYKTYEKNYLLNVNGINVWLKFDELFLLIGDIEKCNEEEFLKVIGKLKKIAFLIGLPHIRFTGSSNTWGIEMFKKYGVKMDNTYPVGGINFTNAIPLEKMKFTMADNDTF